MSFLEHYFKFTENKTSFRTEIIAGVTTFLAMVYIVVINAKILGQAGMSEDAVVTATVILAVFSTIGMGLYAKNPYALAPSMGMNTFFTYTVVKIWHISWQVALGAVFWSGVIFVLLAVFNVRSKILAGIPNAVKHAIGAGIGIFIALIGLYNAGLIQQAPSGLLDVAPITDQIFVFICCLFLLAILLAFRIRAAMLVSIIVGCVLSILFGRLWGTHLLVRFPHEWLSWPNFSLFGALDIWGGLKLSVLPAVLTFLFINIFDSTGTLIGLAEQSKWLDKNGHPIRMKESLLVDSLASSFSGILGSSPTAIFVESSTGISVGGRTGLTAIVTGLLFLPFLFLSPVVTMVPIYVVAPALVVVGSLMMISVKRINWDSPLDSIPAFLTIVMMPLTLSISEGIVWGMVSWFILALVKDRKALTPMACFITACCFLMLLNSLSVF